MEKNKMEQLKDVYLGIIKLKLNKNTINNEFPITAYFGLVMEIKYINKIANCREENIPPFFDKFKKSVTFSVILSIYKCKIS